MENARKNAVQGRDKEYFEQLYEEYDKNLRLDDFIRRYRPIPTRSISVSENDIENAFLQLNKPADDYASRVFDCAACGADSCREMAVRVAKKLSVPENCIEKVHHDLNEEHQLVVDWRERNSGAVSTMAKDMNTIKGLSNKIVKDVTHVEEVIGLYDTLTKDINKIASNIHMISLNASIEAARAGEAGRGFAVVADAIRTLAGETQEATSKVTKASTEAKTSIGAIATTVIDIDKAIDESQECVNEIVASTNEALHIDEKTNRA
jgi:hypothetical protein